MTESISHMYYNLTGKYHLYNITSIKNIPSILQRGIVCYDLAQTFLHTSIAMDNVQRRRSLKSIPNGLRLHQYANLYFTYHNPMMYKRKDDADTICVLVLTSLVLDIDECVVSDMNAAAELVRFYPADVGLKRLDYNLIFAEDWRHPNDYYMYLQHKHIKCAEILVPREIPAYFICGAYVVNQESENKLKRSGFDRKIIIDPTVFYH